MKFTQAVNLGSFQVLLCALGVHHFRYAVSQLPFVTYVGDFNARKERKKYTISTMHRNNPFTATISVVATSHKNGFVTTATKQTLLFRLTPPPPFFTRGPASLSVFSLGIG